MSRRNQKIGAWGEGVAAQYLEEHGYKIAARNARTPHGEIDIVAEKDGISIFVEVKTRTSSKYGPPEMAVTTRKQEHMLTTAEYYAAENVIDHWQIDVFSVEGQPGRKPGVIHFEQAL